MSVPGTLPVHAERQRVFERVFSISLSLDKQITWMIFNNLQESRLRHKLFLKTQNVEIVQTNFISI